jgi:hypothetical protein
MGRGEGDDVWRPCPHEPSTLLSAVDEARAVPSRMFWSRRGWISVRAKSF